MNIEVSGRSILWQLSILEKQEIEKHKWLESEKVHKDIGYDQAVISWCLNHRREWAKTTIAKLRQSPFPNRTFRPTQD